MGIEGPKLWVIAFLVVSPAAPSCDCALAYPCTDEEYYEIGRKDSPSRAPTGWSFNKILTACKQVLHSDFFNTQPSQILDPTNEEMYFELRRSNYYAKYQPDNKTLFKNPYARRKVVVRKEVLENFVIREHEHFLTEFAFTCLVQETEEPHRIQPFFLSLELEKCSEFKGYVFVHNQREEIVVLAKASRIVIPY